MRAVVLDHDTAADMVQDALVRARADLRDEKPPPAWVLPEREDRTEPVVAHDPMRPRKLLLHRNEIEELEAKVSQGGRTLVPLKMYFKHGLVKAEIAVGRGKKAYDKRHAMAQRDADRQMQRELGRRR